MHTYIFQSIWKLIHAQFLANEVLLIPQICFSKRIALVLALLVLFIIDYKFIHLWSRAGMKMRRWQERRRKIIRPQIKGHFAIS